MVLKLEHASESPGRLIKEISGERELRGPPAERAGALRREKEERREAEAGRSHTEKQQCRKLGKRRCRRSRRPLTPVPTRRFPRKREGGQGASWLG